MPIYNYPQIYSNDFEDDLNHYEIRNKIINNKNNKNIKKNKKQKNIKKCNNPKLYYQTNNLTEKNNNYFKIIIILQILTFSLLFILYLIVIRKDLLKINN